MKRKTFFEPFILYAVFLFSCIVAPAVFIALAFHSISLGEKPLYAVILFLFALYSVVVFSWATGSRQDCITVTEDSVIWWCLFRRTRRLSYADCRYIGVETFNKEAQRPIVRGDECAAVYLSMDPFPEKYKGRINHLRCSDRIIKFYYTDALAEAILEVTPKEKAYLLRGFYNQMQNFDREQERLRKSRRKKKKKNR